MDKFKKDYIHSKPKPKMAVNTAEKIPEATKTMYLCLTNTKTKECRTLVLPNFGYRFETFGQNGTLTLMTELVPDDAIIMHDRYEVATLCTNDPTPWTAYDTVSLGYFRFRMEFRDCACVQKKPLIFVGWSRFFKPEMLTPLRDMVE